MTTIRELNPGVSMHFAIIDAVWLRNYIRTSGDSGKHADIVDEYVFYKLQDVWEYIEYLNKHIEKNKGYMYVLNDTALGNIILTVEDGKFNLSYALPEDNNKREVIMFNHYTNQCKCSIEDNATSVHMQELAVARLTYLF